MTPQCKCAAHAGIPGCPTTRSQNGFVKRAAIALWIVPVSARSVSPSTKWSTNTQTARFGDPRRPCTAAVDSAERKATPLRLARIPSTEHAGGGSSSLSRGLDQGAVRGEFGSRAPPRSLTTGSGCAHRLGPSPRWLRIVVHEPTNDHCAQPGNSRKAGRRATHPDRRHRSSLISAHLLDQP
jgi:hypothetical protein